MSRPAPLFSKITTDLKDYWANLLTLIGTVGSTLSGIWTIFQKDNWWRSGTVIVFLISTTLFVIGSVKLWQQTPIIKALQAVVARQEDQLERVEKDYFRTFEIQLETLYNFLNFSDTERINLYRHNGKHFTMIARYSKNPIYCERGRVIYSDNEGCIGKAWSRGYAWENNSPDPSTDETHYVEYMRSEWKMDETVLRSLTMKSRNLYACAIDNFELPSRRSAVIVFESSERNRLNLNRLRSLISGDRFEHIRQLLETMKSLEPSLEKARNEGY